MTESAKPLKRASGPPQAAGVLDWVQRNLLGSWYNVILSLLSLLIVYIALSAFLRWVVYSADWRPILQNPMLFLVGQYPRDQLWRPGMNLLIVSFLLGLSWGVWQGIMRSFAIALAIGLGIAALLPAASDAISLEFRAFLFANPLIIYAGHLLGKRSFVTGRIALMGWLASFVLMPILLRGISGGDLLPSVATTSWGGLLVTLILAVGGILLSFPIGVLLALGRRSSLPVVKIFSTAFIEIVRGVPLITILFMSSIMLALFLPPGLRIDRLVRALIGMTLFSAAYTAENVRGGLQAIPEGQIEAAKAIGLNGFQTTFLIVLPQALRAVIPTIVGQFISLFKDTTLAIIVAINELLSIGKSVIQSDVEFLRLQTEVYVFVAVVFWIFSYFMSYASRRLETTLGVGER
jgi:general L-amino acid transport system permease protein